MSQQALITPKVFISYSWTTPEHEEWVVDLATRLRQDGIDVVFDKWDLKEGHDLSAFMESMVTSDSIDKVLVICDKGYKQKADSRVGGVGTETQIITPQIYNDIHQEKFIPIVSERDEKGEDYIPAYIASRLYIDLSSTEYFEENYEKLIRNIYKVPLYKKPAIGKPPEYLFQVEATNFETKLILRQMKGALDKFPKRLRSYWGEFVDKFLQSLEYLNIPEVKDPNQIDEQILKKIDESLPLRNDFIEALEVMCLADVVEDEQIIEFFEKIYVFSEFQGQGTYYDLQTDHYKFLIHELFLYSITILLKERRYNLVSKIIYADFYVESKFKGDNPLGFSFFRFYLESLRIRNERMQLNRISLHADLIKRRALKKYVNDLIDTDLILYYISKLNNKMDGWKTWFPVTYIYKERGTIKLINKLKSKEHFLNAKTLFNIETESEFKTNIIDFQADRGYSHGWESIPHISRFIQSEDICTLP